MPDHNPRYCALLGITPEGKIVPHIQEGEPSPLGNRFEKGQLFPDSVYLVYEKGRQATPEEHIACLVDLQAWLDRSSHYNKKKPKKK